MQSFLPILYSPPTGGPFVKLAAIIESSNGAQYPLLANGPPAAVTVSTRATETTGEFVDIVFSGSISALPVPALTEFAYTAATVAVAVTAVEVTAQNTLRLTLATPAANGEVLAITYTAGTLLSLSGISVASFGPSAVVNNVPGA